MPGRTFGGRGVLSTVLRAIGVVVAAYLVVRAIVEPFVIDFGDPDSYRSDWGGPSLIGVLLVHSGPGALILLGTFVWYRRRDQDR